MHSYYKRVSKLIAKDLIGGLTPSEEQELADWVGSADKNRKILNRIKHPGNFSTWVMLQDEDSELAWEAVYLAIQSEKRRRIRTYLYRVAAAVVVLFLSCTLFYYLSKERVAQESFITEVTEILPGESKAILLLNDGSSIALASLEDEKIMEKDGSVIKNSDGTLDYRGIDEISTSDILYNTIIVPRGGEYSITLADGTDVYLNSMSEFRYPVRFSGINREVMLSGEGYFEVAESEKPFIVNCNHINIEVLGTAFNINGYSSTGIVTTTLVEGKLQVALEDDDQKVILLPNDQAIFRPEDGLLTVNKVDPSRYTAWKEGKLVFQDVTLSEMMTVIGRWYNVDVAFMDSSVNSLKFSGSLNKYGEIDPILDIIEATKKVRIEVNGTKISFMSRM